MRIFKFFLIAILVIGIDQASKLWVHFNMEQGTIGEIIVFEWFRLHYLLNPGMAFGISLDTEYGKLLLTIFRIISVIGICFWLYWLENKKYPVIYLVSVALILGGATGNLVDSIFYGVWFDNAPFGSPTNWFHGQVIDMLYFPLFDGTFPSWSPIWANEDFLFFRPVFNIADSSIFIGVVLLMLFTKNKA